MGSRPSRPDFHRLERLFTWRRAGLYATILVALYGTAWLYEVAAGSIPLNAAGAPVSGDYIAFHTAGKMVLDGRASELYERASVILVQDSLLNGRVPGFYDPFRNPPFFALPFVPLALLPLLWGFAIWTLVSVGCLIVVLRLALEEAPVLRPRWRTLSLVVVAFPALFFGIVDGENATLSLVLYALIYRALARTQARAGVWAALGLFKPQLFLVFPLLFVCTRRWRTLGVYVASAIFLALISIVLVGPDGVRAWIAIIRDEEASNAAANAWRMVSLQSLFHQLLPSTWAVACYVAGALVLIAAAIQAWRRQHVCGPMVWAFTSLVAVLVDPHLLDYDLTVLVLTGILLAGRLPGLNVVIVLLYAALLVRAQLPLGGAVSLQLSPLILLVLAVMVWRHLNPGWSSWLPTRSRILISPR